MPLPLFFLLLSEGILSLLKDYTTLTVSAESKIAEVAVTTSFVCFGKLLLPCPLC